MNKLFLYGSVGQDWWGDDCITAAAVVESLDGMTGDLTVYLNSGGGLVFEGLSVYNLLREYDGHVRMVIQGVAGSIASVIAMAGDEIVMGDGAMMMVHDPATFWTEGRGTEDDHLQTARALAQAATNMAKLYARQTGLTVDEVREIMRAETWMDGDEALAQGFVTGLAQDPETSEEAAAFDYSIYSNAPAAMKAAGRSLKSEISQPALVAMIAGVPAQERSHGMARKPKKVATRQTASSGEPGAEVENQIEAEADDDQEQEASSSDVQAEGDDPEANSNDAGDEEDEDGAASARTLLRMTVSFGLSASVAEHMIGQNMSASQAAAHLAREVQGENPMTGSNRRGVPRACIIRDERETMREGMTGAIVAQLGRAREVDGPARDFMNMSLVEMAAQAVGHRGALRTATDRIAAFEAAAHSTSDFPAIFENALGTRLLAAYQAQQPTYQRIAERMDFMDFREVPLVRPGDFPDLKKINENGEIKKGTFGESKETAVLSSYGIQVSFSRQMLINDNLGAIDRVLSRYGQRVALFEDRTFYAFALAAKLSDNKAVFHTGHKNLAAAGAGLNVETIDEGMRAVAAQTSIDGDELGLVPSIILTGAKTALSARRLVAQITPGTSEDVNPYAGDFVHVQTPRITGTEWYLLCAPDTGGGSQWTYGFLDGAEGPRVRTDEPFGRQGMSMSVEHDFGVGAADYRFGWKNPGAPEA